MQTRKEIDRGDIKLAIDILADIDDPATEHILGVLYDCGNEIAKLRAENEKLAGESAEHCRMIAYQDQKDAARYRAFAKYMVSSSTDFDDAFVACNTVDELSAVLDAMQ
jgi:hypothetical protein